MTSPPSRGLVEVRKAANGAIVLRVEIDVLPLRKLGAEDERDQREIMVVERPLAAFELPLQFAMCTYVGDALPRPRKPCIDEIMPARQRADRDQVEPGPVDQIVVEMVDALRVARLFGARARGNASLTVSRCKAVVRHLRLERSAR